MAFFEKVGESVSNSINSMSTKTKNAFEASTLSSQLKICEDSLRKCYAEIGKMYYEQNKDNVPAGFETQFANVNEAKDAINETAEKLRNVKNIKVCPGCSAEVSKKSRFCPKCGADCGEPEIPAVPVDNGKCANCGAKLKPGASFCNSCGTKVN